MGLKLRKRKKFNNLVQQDVSDIMTAATTPTITDEDGKLISEGDTIKPELLDLITVSAKRGNYLNVGSSNEVNKIVGQLWQNRFSGLGMFDDNIRGTNNSIEDIRKLYLEDSKETLSDKIKKRARIAIFNNFTPYSYDIPGHFPDFIMGAYDFLKPGKFEPNFEKARKNNYGRPDWRTDAFLIAMNIPDNSKYKSIYKLNNDGTYSVDTELLKDRYIKYFKELGDLSSYSDLYLIVGDLHKNMLHKIAPKLFDDFFVGNHGTFKVVEDNGKYTMEDDWTLRPFRKAGFLPRKLRELEFIELLGGNPFVLHYDVSDINLPDEEDISKNHIPPSNYNKRKLQMDNRMRWMNKHKKQ